MEDCTVSKCANPGIASFHRLGNLLPESPGEILCRGHHTAILSERKESESIGGHHFLQKCCSLLPFGAQRSSDAAMYVLRSERSVCRIRLSPDVTPSDRSDRSLEGKKGRRPSRRAITPLLEGEAAGGGGAIVPEISNSCLFFIGRRGSEEGEGLNFWRTPQRGHLPLAMISSSAAELPVSLSDTAIAKGSGASAAQEKFKEAVTKAQAIGEKFVKTLQKEKPPVDVELSSWEPAQGDTVAVLVALPSPQSFLDVLVLSLREKLHKGPLVRVRYGDDNVPAHLYVKAPPVWRALIPTTPLHKAGPHVLMVEVYDGRHRPFTGTVNLQEREFPVESIWLSDTKAGISGTAKELQAVAAFRGARSPEQLWHGPFGQPSDGIVTTGYGLQRFYNGVFAEGYYHRGIDYGAETGEPVKAPAGARVVMVGRESEGFAVHGNCVGLDHGHGVLSLMMHLHTIDVTEGTVVRAGERVGTVGETGIATGPHLHWGFYVNGECVDPHQWMKPQSWS